MGDTPSSTLTGLVCPLRGPLTAAATVKGSFKPSEEARRIDAIEFLLSRGYPAEHITVETTVARIGHKGRNSMRADLAVFDIPASEVNRSDPDAVAKHALLLGEVKRDALCVKSAHKHQVEPLLKFADNEQCIALYWDGVDDRYLWKARDKDNQIEVRNSGVASMPRWGEGTKAKPLTFGDLTTSENLVTLFDAIRDILHTSYSTNEEERYHLIFKLLLTKLFDEGRHAMRPDTALDIQDFAALGTHPGEARTKFVSVVDQAISHYQHHLPVSLETGLPEEFRTDSILAVLSHLAPVKITGSSQEVVQTFYMQFAKNLYRYDMAQYWTPVLLTEFVIAMLNPQSMEHVRDPACGGSDFLTSAFRRNGGPTNPSYANCIWGADISKQSVQVAVLNMMLNGDGKSSIKREDSLLREVEAPGEYDNRFDILVCNPPFGTKIAEERHKVLAGFEMGHEWERDDEVGYVKTQKVRERVETGLLFAELCVRQTKPGGRLGLIVPNGYLNNTSIQYLALRHYLLRHCRAVSVVAFPRYTFKTSGADVSASVIFFEKRKKPLAKLADDTSYKMHVSIIERVGWNLRAKTAEPLFAKNPIDGSLIYENGQPKVLADFNQALSEARSSDASQFFKWLTDGASDDSSFNKGWSVPISTVLNQSDIPLDAKRLAKKYQTLVPALEQKPHYKLEDLVEFVERIKPADINSDQSYLYAQLDDIADGACTPKLLRAWDLPSRARRRAEPGDVFVGSVWGSVGKWMLTPANTENLLITTGCLQLRIKDGIPYLDENRKLRKDSPLIDLVAVLNLEAYSVQMRAWARGSDGLASISSEDAAKVLIPRVTDKEAREAIYPFVENLLAGFTTLRARVGALIEDGELDAPVPEARYDHTVVL